MEIDHVLIAVPDLAAAGREIEARYRLASIEGGHHPAWGTANRIVPLGDSYLELIGVVDPGKAAGHVVGRWVASAVSHTFRPLGWAVRTSHLDEIARRLELPVNAGSRITPSGEELRWRSAGVGQAAIEPCLPFFIEWAPGTLHPGRGGKARIVKVVLEGDPDRLAYWLGDHHLPIVMHAGNPAVKAIHISGDSGEFALTSYPRE